jgi:hypothetical protein
LSEQFFSKDNLPEGDFGLFRKQYDTPAVRVEGTFHCLTSEGNVASCTDGWLGVDSRGFPYPINRDEFHRTYVQVDASVDLLTE